MASPTHAESYLPLKEYEVRLLGCGDIMGVSRGCYCGSQLQSSVLLIKEREREILTSLLSAHTDLSLLLRQDITEVATRS